MHATRPETEAFVDAAPVRVVARRTIPAPPEAVFDALADAPGWADWFPGMKRAAWTSEETGGLGSTRQVEFPGFVVEERFIVWERPHRWGFTFIATNRKMVAAGVELVVLEPTDSGTDLTYTMALEPSGAGRLLIPLSKGRVAKSLRDALASLEARLS